MHINTNLYNIAHTFKVIAYYISNNNNTNTITDFWLSWWLVINVDSVLALLHGMGMIKVVDILEIHGGSMSFQKVGNIPHIHME
jgi:hypothetical protein